jgi:hypothetical protein
MPRKEIRGVSAMTSVYETKAHFSRLSEDVFRDPSLKGAAFHGAPCAPVAETDWPEELR